MRQIGLDSYPCRSLYSIDFNRHKIADRIRKKALLNDDTTLTDAKVQALVSEQLDLLRKRMPFKLTILRDVDDKENLSIVSIVDRENVQVLEGNVEIHIQSLGADEKYWLDSGSFNF